MPASTLTREWVEQHLMTLGLSAPRYGLPLSDDGQKVAELCRHWLATQWQELPPKKAGVYLVSNPKLPDVRQARWLPKTATWKFASAQQSFDVARYMPLPPPPEQTP